MPPKAHEHDHDHETTPQAGTHGGSHRRTIKLASGGSLAFSCEVNLLQLSAEDRTFLFGLIDQLTAYDDAHPLAKLGA